VRGTFGPAPRTKTPDVHARNDPRAPLTHLTPEVALLADNSMVWAVTIPPRSWVARLGRTAQLGATGQKVQKGRHHLPPPTAPRSCPQHDAGKGRLGSDGVTDGVRSCRTETLFSVHQCQQTKLHRTAMYLIADAGAGWNKKDSTIDQTTQPTQQKLSAKCNKNARFSHFAPAQFRARAKLPH
jgi:hypothetical protein